MPRVSPPYHYLFIYFFFILGKPFNETLFFNGALWRQPNYIPPCKCYKGAAVICSHCHKHRGKPLLFHDKCPGFFYVHYTTHGTYKLYVPSEERSNYGKVPCSKTQVSRLTWLGIEPTFCKQQNLNLLHQTARPQHSINYWLSKFLIHIIGWTICNF